MPNQSTAGAESPKATRKKRDRTKTAIAFNIPAFTQPELEGSLLAAKVGVMDVFHAGSTTPRSVTQKARNGAEAVAKKAILDYRSGLKAARDTEVKMLREALPSFRA